nr:MAG TPA: hypothetical protein [Caudoviricetes sp.]
MAHYKGEKRKKSKTIKGISLREYTLNVHCEYLL